MFITTTVTSCLADTSITRTAAKSPARIGYRRLTEINSCYYGFSLRRALTCGPKGVHRKGVDCNMVCGLFSCGFSHGLPKTWDRLGMALGKGDKTPYQD